MRWPGGHTAGTASIAGGAVSAINLTFGGSFYQSPPTVTIAPPASGIQATATATVSGGVVTGFTITNPGSGYTSAPAVTIGPLNVSLLGINPGTGDVGQSVTSITAVSSNPSLIPKPSITYPNTDPTTGIADPDERYAQLHPGVQRQRHGA